MSDDPMDASELMSLAKNGDASAFGKLYTQYFTPIYRYIYLRVKTPEIANDLAQTVFLKVYERIGSIENLSNPLSYFFTVARNTVIDHWRKKREVSLDDHEGLAENIESHEDDPDEHMQKKELGESVWAKLKGLTDEQQEVLTLKYMSDLSNKEIAGLLKKSEEAVRQLQCRALKSLRQKFV